jgi:hypothetical protein
MKWDANLQVKYLKINFLDTKSMPSPKVKEDMLKGLCDILWSEGNN